MVRGSLYSGKRLSNIQEAILKQQVRFEEPPRLAYRWPFALDLLLEATRADKAGRILDFFLDLIRRTGDTFEQVLLGAREIDTQDPANLEAVLSTQFGSR